MRVSKRTARLMWGLTVLGAACHALGFASGLDPFHDLGDAMTGLLAAVVAVWFGIAWVRGIDPPLRDQDDDGPPQAPVSGLRG